MIAYHNHEKHFILIANGETALSLTFSNRPKSLGSFETKYIIPFLLLY